jgi:PAS domain S-box-containing protein
VTENIIPPQQFLDRALGGCPVAVLIIDTNHNVTHWNTACEDLTGVPSDEAVGGPIPSRAFYIGKSRPLLANLVLEEREDEIHKLYAGKNLKPEKLSSGAFSAVDSLHLRGKPVMIHFLAAAIRDEQGNIIGAIETLQDITPQTNAENELRQRSTELLNSNIDLERKNVALQELMSVIQNERDRLGQTIQGNLHSVVLPMLAMLRQGLGQHHIRMIEQVELAINTITSPFVDRLTGTLAKLTPTEIRICWMIHQGRTTKEIAATEHIAPTTVSKHRRNIRAKLDITNTGSNLQSVLAQAVGQGKLPPGDPRQNLP